MRNQQGRQGAVTVLVLVLIVAMLILSAFCIGVSQIQLANAEAQMVADCCAMSATAILGEEVDDELNTPQKMGRGVAAASTIGGTTVKIRDEDITPGSARVDRSGRVAFIPGGTPANAVRARIRLGSGGRRAAEQLLFPVFQNSTSFNVDRVAISAKLEHDICLVFDRSQSMTEHKTHRRPKPHHPKYDPPKSFKESLFPHPNDSRWAAVVHAVIPLAEALGETPIKEKLAVVTFASDRKFTFHGRKYKTRAATTDARLTTDYGSCHRRLKRMFQTVPMVNGETWIHAGIDEGVRALFGSGSRNFAFKTMVLLTDGAQYVSGGKGKAAHFDAARRAVDRGVTIHTITFGSPDGYAGMKKIAEIGDGKCFYAPNAHALYDIFSDVGVMPPVSLVK